MQARKAGFAGGVQQEVVITPIAHAPQSLRPPGQQREHDANFQTQDNVEDDAESRRHTQTLCEKSFVAKPRAVFVKGRHFLRFFFCP